MSWALFYRGAIASKQHPHKRTAMIEAFERGIVKVGSCDFDGLIAV